MNSTRTLARTPAYLVMVALSAVSALLGVFLVVDKLPAMEAGLEAQTATTALVYGGQSWVVVGAALLGAGILGLVLALGVAALRSVTRPVVVAPLDESILAVEPKPEPGSEDETDADAVAETSPEPVRG